MEEPLCRLSSVNDNDRWPIESSVHLIELSGKVLTAILRRLMLQPSVDACDIVAIIRQSCAEVPAQYGVDCPEMLTIASLADSLEPREAK